VSQVLGNDAGSRLVFLFNVVLVLVLGFGRTGGVGASNVIDAVCGFDVNGGGAELSVVEKEGSLRRAAEGIDKL
jgi:hypothetical protein